MKYKRAQDHFKALENLDTEVLSEAYNFDDDDANYQLKELMKYSTEDINIATYVRINSKYYLEKGLKKHKKST